MARNSFKDLQKLEMENIPGPPAQIENNVRSSIGLIAYVGRIVELYIPQVFQLFIAFTGGKPSSESTGRGPANNPERGPGKDFPGA